MKSLDKYIIYTSIFSLFTEAFSFHYIIDWKLFYIFLITNLVLLWVRNKTLYINKTLLFVLSFFLIHGIVSYLFLNNPISSLFSQLMGISLSSIFYYNVLKTYGSNKLFNTYLDFSLYIALLAILMYFINGFEGRLYGILSEPAHYAAIMLPATYVFLRNKNYYKFSIILITILLSKSSIGYIGLILILLIPLFRIKYFLRYSLITIIILGLSTYYISTKWNKPINENKSNEVVRRLVETNESLKAIYSGAFKEFTNLSSYALLSNTFITREIISHKPFGTGLGAYPYEYDKYYHLMKPPPYLIEQKLSQINRTDANSLFLRGLSDFGIFWLIFILYFTYISFKLFKKEDFFRQGTFFYLIVKLIREGHYFPPEFYFFLLILLKEFDESTTHS